MQKEFNNLLRNDFICNSIKKKKNFNFFLRHQKNQCCEQKKHKNSDGYNYHNILSNGKIFRFFNHQRRCHHHQHLFNWEERQSRSMSVDMRERKTHLKLKS